MTIINSTLFDIKSSGKLIIQNFTFSGNVFTNSAESILNLTEIEFTNMSTIRIDDNIIKDNKYISFLKIKG